MFDICFMVLIVVFFIFVVVSVDIIEFGLWFFYLIDQMSDGDFKDKLQVCVGQFLWKIDFLIGYCGVLMQFFEYMFESYCVVVVMGVGILECDVIFIKDYELVCCYVQDDLYISMNILVSGLVFKCSKGFILVFGDMLVFVDCWVLDFILVEFLIFSGKMDGVN